MSAVAFPVVCWVDPITVGFTLGFAFEILDLNG